MERIDWSRAGDQLVQIANYTSTIGLIHGFRASRIADKLVILPQLVLHDDVRVEALRFPSDLVGARPADKLGEPYDVVIEYDADDVVEKIRNYGNKAKKIAKKRALSDKGEPDNRYQAWMDNFHLLDPQVYDLRATIGMSDLEKSDESTRERCFHKGEELSGFQMSEVTRQKIERSMTDLGFRARNTSVEQSNHHQGLASVTVDYGPLSVRFSTVFGIFEYLVPKK